MQKALRARVSLKGKGKELKLRNLARGLSCGVEFRRFPENWLVGAAVDSKAGE